MQIPHSVQVGDKVLILRPFYVTGKVGVVCGRESHSDGQSSTRWLIQVDSDEENIIVSLRRNEFEVITPELK
ncbi:MAG: hypothetical protein RMX35_20095 [Nostoc sp. DcaGUA01]|nr:hypothetical protein [Nostoc sp. SerVER01]MDZ8023839.1 hypothetical protein [Nostoc sp. DedQUE11]MDZ8076504.1 hypothetical protein [Nostoc sp. DedQUE01]MDZ8081353.1 hypothetical protein [Nostoc sp. DcaGUA01]